LITKEIKEFYSRINFPGRYQWQDIEFYHEHGIHNRYLKEIDKSMCNNIDVLDVGCGTGLVSNVFATKYTDSTFTSIDFSDSIDYAVKFASDNNITNVRWIKKDFLKFKTNKQYDLIICCGVLHHIPNYQLALEKLKSMLKPGGQLILAVYNPFGKILKRFFAIKYNSNTLYEDQENNPFEISFTDGQVKKMCNDLIFKRVEPSISNRLVNLLACFNSKNGGLAIYVFSK
jgi:2-polyprenyl-3-methyl-5-hydroxy-6-metoxy-1,4-benzoquinol methylase